MAAIITIDMEQVIMAYGQVLLAYQALEGEVILVCLADTRRAFNFINLILV